MQVGVVMAVFVLAVMVGFERTGGDDCVCLEGEGVQFVQPWYEWLAPL